MFKVIWQKAALPPHIDGAVVFARLRQCAHHQTHASLGPPESSTHMACQLVQPFLHNSWQSVVGLGHVLPLKNCPFAWNDLDPRLIRGSLGLSDSKSETVSRSVQLFFAQLVAECPYSLQWTTISPSKLHIPMWASGPPSNRWFHGPIQAQQPKWHLD